MLNKELINDSEKSDLEKLIEIKKLLDEYEFGSLQHLKNTAPYNQCRDIYNKYSNLSSQSPKSNAC